MRRILIDFKNDTITTEGLGLDDIPPGDLGRAKNAICALLSIKTETQTAVLDFEQSTICCDGHTVTHPELAYYEPSIELLLWYHRTAMTNVLDLVDAMLGGNIDIATFRAAMLLEGNQWEPNARVSEFLNHIADGRTPPAMEW